MTCMRTIWLLFVFFMLSPMKFAESVFEVVKKPLPVAILRGETARLTCEVSHPINTSYLIWAQITASYDAENPLGPLFSVQNADATAVNKIRSDAELPRQTRYGIKYDGKNNYDLEITDAQIVDDSEYTCYTGETDTDGAQLTVAVKATDNTIYNGDDSNIVYNDVNSVVVTEGESLALACQTKGGRPITEFTWFRNDVAIECIANECDGNSESPDTPGTFDSFSIYRFDPTPSDNGAMFNCSGVQDAVPAITSPHVQYVVLDVRFAPIVTVKFEVTVPEAYCETEANPATTKYTWIINGIVDEQQTTATWPAPEESKWELEIICQAENDIGPGQNNITVGPYLEVGEGAEPSNNLGTIIGGCIASGCVLIFLIAGAIYLLKAKKTDDDDISWCIKCNRQSNVKSENIYAIPIQHQPLESAYTGLISDEIVEPNSSVSTYSDVNSKNWEFPRHWLVLREKIGTGAFGLVWRAEARNIAGHRGRTVVAVKTLKAEINQESRKEFLLELEFMKLLAPHQNVVSLLGCCTDNDPIYIIIEYVPHGNLKFFLRSHRSQSSPDYKNIHSGSKDLTPHDLLSFAYGTAKGMAYLSSMKCIHRDLAARNILVGDDNICKVSDFGFARDVLDTGEYEKKTQGRLPLCWMALESLVDSVYTLKSDVWSFGVLLWEIVTMGSSPYPGMSAAQVIENLQGGYRMPKPEHCSQEIYDMMLHCWEVDQKQRISFSLLVKQLEKMMKNESNDIEIVDLDEEVYYSVEKYSIAGEIV